MSTPAALAAKASAKTSAADAVLSTDSKSKGEERSLFKQICAIIENADNYSKECSALGPVYRYVYSSNVNQEGVSPQDASCDQTIKIDNEANHSELTARVRFLFDKHRLTNQHSSVIFKRPEIVLPHNPLSTNDERVVYVHQCNPARDVWDRDVVGQIFIEVSNDKTNPIRIYYNLVGDDGAVTVIRSDYYFPRLIPTTTNGYFTMQNGVQTFEPYFIYGEGKDKIPLHQELLDDYSTQLSKVPFSSKKFCSKRRPPTAENRELIHAMQVSLLTGRPFQVGLGDQAAAAAAAAAPAPAVHVASGSGMKPVLFSSAMGGDAKEARDIADPVQKKLVKDIVEKVVSYAGRNGFPTMVDLNRVLGLMSGADYKTQLAKTLRNICNCSHAESACDLAKILLEHMKVIFKGREAEIAKIVNDLPMVKEGAAELPRAAIHVAALKGNHTLVILLQKAPYNADPALREGNDAKGRTAAEILGPGASPASNAARPA